MAAAVGDASQFTSARHFAAWLGLTPRISASGNREHVRRISKGGDRYLRTLLIHGARAMVGTSFRRGISAAAEIPANTYSKLQPDGAAVPVTTMEAVILISKDISEDTAYRITKAMLENQDRFATIYQVLGKFDPKLAWQNQPVPLHPGAEKAYRELGYME